MYLEAAERPPEAASTKVKDVHAFAFGRDMSKSSQVDAPAFNVNRLFFKD